MVILGESAWFVSDDYSPESARTVIPFELTRFGSDGMVIAFQSTWFGSVGYNLCAGSVWLNRLLSLGRLGLAQSLIAFDPARLSLFESDRLDSARKGFDSPLSNQYV